MTEIQNIALRLLKPDPDNPRRKPGDVGELAASMKSAGVIEPLVAVKIGTGYEVVIGTRRLAAAKLAGLTEVPVIVRDMDEKTRAEAMLIENLQRDDLLPTEEAAGLARLLEIGGYTQRTLAQRIGRSQSHVAKRIALLKLPKKVQDNVDSGRITLADCEHLTQLADEPDRIKRVLGEPRSQWRSLGDIAAREVDDMQREHKRAAVVEKVKAGYDPYVELTDVGGLPDGVEYVGRDWSGVNISEAKHKKEPCHAVVVSSYSADVEAVCTEPSRHPEYKDDYASAVTEGRRLAGSTAKDAERDKALKAAAKARRQVIVELLPARHTQKEALDILLSSVLRNAGQTPRIEAVKLLGLEPKKGSGPWAVADHTAPLREYAAESEANTLRVAIALGLGWTEANAFGVFGGWLNTKEHFAFLKGYGHKLQPVERQMIKGGDE